MRSLVTIAALLATTFAATYSTSAQTITAEYTFRKASVSIPVLSQGSTPDFQAVINTTRLMSRQVINLARGRALKDKVPKNEVLAVAVPEIIDSFPTYLVVIDTEKIDKSQKPFVGQDGVILATIGEMTSFNYVFGKPNGTTSKGFGTVDTRNLGDTATNGAFSTSFRAAAKLSRNRLLATGLTGTINLVLDGTPTSGIVAGGTLRSSGGDLFTKVLQINPPAPE